MKKLRLRSWVKYVLAETIIVLCLFGFLKIMDVRLHTACNNGYTAICPVDGD